MKLLLSSNSNSEWLNEHAQTIHRACLRIQRVVRRGEKVQAAIRQVAESLHDHPFKCDPTRRFILTVGTMRRHWDRWKLNGKCPAAVRMQYRTRIALIPKPLLIRFVNFCAHQRLPSVRIAWSEFGSQPQNTDARQFSHGQLTYIFAVADFYLMQKQIKAIETAKGNLDYLISKMTADISKRLVCGSNTSAEHSFKI